MKWIGERISMNDDKKRTTFVIYPERIVWLNRLVGTWMLLWYIIGITVITSLFLLKLNDQEKIILWVFLTFWVYYAYRVTRTFTWIIWGKEYIKIDETALVLKKSVRNVGKATPFYLENIKKISTDIPKAKSLQQVWEASPWIKGADRIEFEYLGKMIRFGNKLNEKDTKLLFNVITKRIEEKLKLKEKKS